MEERSLPVAFVGLGRIASLLEDDPLREKPASHAGAVRAHPACRIVGGYDREPARVRAFAERWGTEPFPSFRQMLAMTSPRIVVIATHPDSHEHYVAAAARAGVPVVVCEKPVAHRLASARRIAAWERRGPTRIVVNHERRFSRDYVLAREALRDQYFGDLQAVTARLFFGRDARHDRVFLHDGTHLVDAINFLTDGSLRLRRRVGRYRSSRSSVFFHGQVRRATGTVPVVIEVGAGRDYLHLETTVSCRSGEIVVGNGLFRWSESQPSPYYSAYRSLVSLHRRPPEPTGYFAGVVAEAVRLARDPSARSRSSAADGLAAMREIARARRLW